MAVKPWLGAVRNSVPTDYSPNLEGGQPDQQLELEYVYGYRCDDTRNNLRYTAKGQVVYHTAAVGIVLDQGRNTQTHHLEHNDDIISLDANGHLVVTG